MLGKELLAAGCLALTATGAAAMTPASLRTDYDALQSWRFETTATPVPSEGLAWALDVASWHLAAGGLRLQEPTADGIVTGLVFEGEGRFALEVPDPIELRQLRRFAEEPELAGLDLEFDRMVLRWSGAAPFAVAGLPTGPFTEEPTATDRHRHWLEIRGFDADARIVAALATPGDRFLRADMRTREYGWLTFTFDLQQDEEIEVERFEPRHAVVESWLSLDRREDRQAGGRPGRAHAQEIDIRQVAVEADLSRRANESPVGFSDVQPLDGRFTATMTFAPLADGARALQLFLAPRAKVTAVRDGSGASLDFLRDHLGARSSTIDKKVYDDSLVVLLPQPLVAGSETTVSIDYELEVDCYGAGRSWYPRGLGGILDQHLVRLTLTARDDYTLRAMGTLEDRHSADGLVTATWVTQRPVRMATFSLARKYYEAVLELPDVPEIRVFSSLGGYLNPDRVEGVAADVANAFHYFTQLFGPPSDRERLDAAIIPATHGQAFDGFLHIGDYSTSVDNVAAVELFRAHEVAHQWWGHRVGWHGYRDQWLSEGFAEYSAMLFVEASLDDGPKKMEEMVRAFGDIVTGSIKSSFSQFSRPGILLDTAAALDRIGPIAHGWRATVGEAPSAYHTQAYFKGALVLHMLRTLTGRMTGSDDAFFRILRTFAERFGGADPTTADFESVVSEVVPADWSWFFDEWVYGSEIPTYLWSSDSHPEADGWVLDLRVEQRGVAPGFRMAIPVRVDLGGGRDGTLLAFVDQPVKEFHFPLPAKPRKVDFNADDAILARVKKN